MKDLQNFDVNACYGLLPAVKQQLFERVDTRYLNPSGVHQLGQLCRAQLESDRQTLSAFLGVRDSHRLIFNSGATEANNTALSTVLYRRLSGQTKTAEAGMLPLRTLKIACTAIEHHSVLNYCRHLAALFAVEINEISCVGALTTEEILGQIEPDTDLVSIMSANNETGVILPVDQVFSKLKSLDPSIITHTDAVQLPGKVDLSKTKQFNNADFVSFSGHKFGALPGTGILGVRKSIDSENWSLLHGGPQESRWRAGTENTSGIHSMALAAAEKAKTLTLDLVNLAAAKNQLLETIATMENVAVNHLSTDGPETLPNTISLQISGVRADDLVVALDLNGYAVSSGAACASGKPLPSHVLLALGRTQTEALSTIRISLPSDINAEQVTQFAKILRSQISMMRNVK